jgi:DNA-binding IclR family transcriptional regulator
MEKSVRTVERALDILLCFTKENELTLTEISRMTGLNKSTVYRLLNALAKKGFVDKNKETEKYRLGFAIWELSVHLERGDDPAVLLLPEMERLRDLLDETVTLYIRDGRERVRVQAVESRQTIRRVAPIGARMPLYVGASGKILVAYAPHHVQEYIFSDPHWPDSIVKDQFRFKLQAIKKQGYATSFEEREAGTAAISAPIVNRKGECVAALAVSGPSGRMTQDKMKQFAPFVVEAASRMGKMLF